LKQLSQVLILLLWILGSPISSGAADNPRRMEVTAKRFAFVPDSITVKKGEPVDIALRSADAYHGLKFKEFGVQVDVPKGETRDLSFTPTRAGTFVGQCSHFCGRGHGEMKLTLIVTE